MCPAQAAGDAAVDSIEEPEQISAAKARGIGLLAAWDLLMRYADDTIKLDASTEAADYVTELKKSLDSHGLDDIWKNFSEPESFREIKGSELVTAFSNVVMAQIFQDTLRPFSTLNPEDIKQLKKLSEPSPSFSQWLSSLFCRPGGQHAKREPNPPRILQKLTIENYKNITTDRRTLNAIKAFLKRRENDMASRLNETPVFTANLDDPIFLINLEDSGIDITQEPSHLKKLLNLNWEQLQDRTKLHRSYLASSFSKQTQLKQIISLQKKLCDCMNLLYKEILVPKKLRTSVEDTATKSVLTKLDETYNDFLKLQSDADIDPRFESLLCKIQAHLITDIISIGERDFCEFNDYLFPKNTPDKQATILSHACRTPSPTKPGDPKKPNITDQALKAKYLQRVFGVRPLTTPASLTRQRAFTR